MAYIIEFLYSFYERLDLSKVPAKFRDSFKRKKERKYVLDMIYSDFNEDYKKELEKNNFYNLPRLKKHHKEEYEPSPKPNNYLPTAPIQKVDY